MDKLIPEGVLLLDKPEGTSSFSMVGLLRKKTGQLKIGHTGTLDPFATGLLVLLFGRRWTRMLPNFLHHDKEYEACLCLGAATDTYDKDGVILATSFVQPSEDDIWEVLQDFQGRYLQTPPMFSAKKVGGKRLYELARKGITISRTSSVVKIITRVSSYEYPFLNLHIQCSTGTYIRSIASDIGERLGCYAYVTQLRRTRCGPFLIDAAVSLLQVDGMTEEELCHRFILPEAMSEGRAL